MVRQEVKLKKLLAVVGPTAAGKTELALALAPKLGAEIVCLDSAQVYKGLDIGTAKPTPEEKAVVKHHLFDVIEPTDRMNAARYVKLADEVLADIAGRAKVPMLVGGTGLWLRALVHGLFEAPPPDPTLRRKLESRLDAEGVEALHAELARIDEDTARHVAQRDRQRILRALEFYYQTGETISAARAKHAFADKRYECRVYFLDRPRSELKARLKSRLKAMLENGWIEETRDLLESGVPKDAQAFRAHGYRHVIAVLEGRMTIDRAEQVILKEHWAYTKRSRTWFKKMDGVVFLETPVDVHAVLKDMKEFVHGS